MWDPNRRRWVKVRPRNEALDTWCYALAAAHHPGLRVHAWKEPQWAKLETALQPGQPGLFDAPAKPVDTAFHKPAGRSADACEGCTAGGRSTV